MMQWLGRSALRTAAACVPVFLLLGWIITGELSIPLAITVALSALGAGLVSHSAEEARREFKRRQDAQGR